MTLDDLRAFVAACQAGNLSAAARELSRTQSAVSQHVKRLEGELGLTLLERQPRGVTPTHAGDILYRAAHQGIGHIEDALRQLRDLRRGAGGAVRITTGPTTVRHFMAAAIVAFRRRYPAVSLDFRTENSSRACLAALTANDADIAWITIGPPARGIEQHPVIELPWVLAVRPEDPLAGRDSIEAADLATLHHIQLPADSASGAQLMDQLRQQGARPASTTSVADWDTAILLAELGLGHALVPALPGWATSQHGGLRLIPVPSLPRLTAGWAVRQWSALSPLAQGFAREVAAQLPT
jgi:DNA-binding transcriptional LysR family regulator